MNVLFKRVVKFLLPYGIVKIIKEKKYNLFYRSEKKYNLKWWKKHCSEYKTFGDNETTKTCLIVCHELSLTGGPIVNINLAKNLRKNGYKVFFVSPIDGPLKEELKKNKFSYFIIPNILTNNVIKNSAKNFNLIFLSTCVCCNIAKQFCFTTYNVIWWIHDAFLSYKYLKQGGFKPFKITNNIKLYFGGDYARNAFKSFFDADGDLLVYKHLPLQKKINLKNISYNLNKTLNVTCIGTIDDRKRQDIIVDAFNRLNINEIKKFNLYFIGKNNNNLYFAKIMNLKQKYPKNVFYIECMKNYELVKFCKEKIDFLISCSSDDPMPVVIADMLSLNKIIISSTHNGYYFKFKQDKSAILLEKNTPIELRNTLRDIIQNKINLSKIASNTNKTYFSLFDYRIFDNKIKYISSNFDNFKSLNKIDIDSVSFIIPTFNASKTLELLLKSIYRQKIKSMEIIIIDSESRDNTIEIAKKYDCKIFSIKKENFSHSYARNFGAKKASNNYLIFLTQDVELLHNTVYTLLKTIKKENLSAISCLENVKADSDTYYKYCSNLYSSLFSKKTINNKETLLRKQVSLNGTCLLTRKDVFEKFLFKSFYGEDLLYGLDLNKCGYKTKLICKKMLIHGHNRDAYYYFLRSFLDVQLLNENDLLIKSKNNEDSEESILSAYFNLLYLINEICNKNIDVESLKTNNNLNLIYSYNKTNYYFSEKKIDKLLLDNLKHNDLFCCNLSLYCSCTRVFYDAINFVHKKKIILSSKELAEFLYKILCSQLACALYFDNKLKWIKILENDFKRI